MKEIHYLWCLISEAVVLIKSLVYRRKNNWWLLRISLWISQCITQGRGGKVWIPSHSMVMWYRNSCDVADQSCVLEVWVKRGIQRVSRMCTEHNLKEWSVWFLWHYTDEKKKMAIAMIPPHLFFLSMLNSCSQKMCSNDSPPSQQGTLCSIITLYSFHSFSYPNHLWITHWMIFSLQKEGDLSQYQPLPSTGPDSRLYWC